MCYHSIWGRRSVPSQLNRCGVNSFSNKVLWAVRWCYERRKGRDRKLIKVRMYIVQCVSAMLLRNRKCARGVQYGSYGHEREGRS